MPACDPARTESTEALFLIVWETLVRVLGATATATLVRRSARIAAAARPDAAGLRALDAVRDEMRHRFVMPDSWHDDGGTHHAELRLWVRHGLQPLLVELTGPVLVRLLAREPALRCHDIVRPDGEST